MSIKSDSRSAAPPLEDLISAAIAWADWRSSDTGEWVFRTDRSGKEWASLAPLVVAIRRAPNGKFPRGRFVYSLSGPGDKFVVRRDRE